MSINWKNIQNLKPISYKCGYCDTEISSEKGYIGDRPNSSIKAYIVICHTCSTPTFFSVDNEQTPGSSIGREVRHIPNDSVAELFREAKECFSISAYTASVMLARKLLMNLSVSFGAKEGGSFASYVDYLNDNGYIPPNGKEWVDSIRRLGNSANHKIEFKTKPEAERIIGFTEMLLRFTYELPGIMKETIEQKD